MNLKRLYRNGVTGLLICLIGGVCILGFLRWDIQSDLVKRCTVAQAAHPHSGDHVAALLDYVQSDLHTLEKRNRAVWALGQTRDSRALPILEKYLSGEDCDHAATLCQSEIKKAIALCCPDSLNLLCIKTPSN